MNRPLIVVALTLLCLAAPAPAAAPARPMRALIVDAETVVVAAPADPQDPARLRVLHTCLGSALKEGDVFEIDNLSSYDLTVSSAGGAPGRKPARVTEALFFLGPEKAGPPPAFPLVPFGMRLRTADEAYYPYASESSRKCFLTAYRRGFSWDDLLRAADADAAEVRRVRSLKAISDAHRRNVALLDWAERHRREFGGGLGMEDGEEPSSGWGSLEQDVFTWVLESQIPEDGWAAVKLYAELNQGWLPDLKTPAFGTRAGRSLLLAVAGDRATLAGNRVRALELLARPPTLWPPAAEALDEMGQAALIDGVAPLLKDADAPVRAAASQALLEASWPRPDALRTFRADRALPALTEAYRAEAPGPVHDAIAEAVGAVAGPKRWQELTGNAHGVVAVLKEPQCRQAAEGDCRLVVLQGEEAVHEGATLVLERLDNAKVAEKKEKALHSMAPTSAHYPTARGDFFCEYFTFSMADCTPGAWRLTIKGTAGADNAPWASEPRLLLLAPPPPPANPPIADPTRPRIYFDGTVPPPQTEGRSAGGAAEKAILDILK